MGVRRRGRGGCGGGRRGRLGGGGGGCRRGRLGGSGCGGGGCRHCHRPRRWRSHRRRQLVAAVAVVGGGGGVVVFEIGVAGVVLAVVRSAGARSSSAAVRIRFDEVLNKRPDVGVYGGGVVYDTCNDVVHVLLVFVRAVAGLSYDAGGGFDRLAFRLVDGLEREAVVVGGADQRSCAVGEVRSVAQGRAEANDVWSVARREHVERCQWMLEAAQLAVESLIEDVGEAVVVEAPGGGRVVLGEAVRRVGRGPKQVRDRVEHLFLPCVVTECREKQVPGPGVVGVTVVRVEGAEVGGHGAAPCEAAVVIGVGGSRQLVENDRAKGSRVADQCELEFELCGLGGRDATLVEGARAVARLVRAESMFAHGGQHTGRKFRVDSRDGCRKEHRLFDRGAHYHSREAWHGAGARAHEVRLAIDLVLHRRYVFC